MDENRDDDLLCNKSKDGENDDKLEDLQKTIGEFITEALWTDIGKKLQDYTLNDFERIPFLTKKKCREFYNFYGKVMGFGIRDRGENKSRRDGVQVTQLRYVCRREGHNSRKRKIKPLVTDNEDVCETKGTKKPNFTRCGCTAHMKFKFENSVWRVVSFENVHNHDLIAPEHIYYDSCFKTISKEQSEKIDSMFKARTPKCCIMPNMVREAGSRNAVGFGPKELYNHCDKIKREQVKYGDVASVMTFLAGIQSKDPSLFVSYTKNEEGRLNRLFWCDGTSRLDYKTFGHALGFDGTYRCNTYNMPFIVLSGVNNHWKTVCFACALVVDEKEESFSWVLQQMVKVGDGKKPLTVVTDGDRAMAKAISIVLPEAKHRLCLWHLLRNVKSHNKKFINGFMRCVDRCQTPADFEESWAELVQCYEVGKKNGLLICIRIRKSGLKPL